MNNSLQLAIAAWRQQLGEGAVLTAEAIPQRYRQDTSPTRRDVLAVLTLRSADQVPEVMRAASQFGVPVHPISTGRNWGYGSSLPAAQASVIIDLSGLTRILDFDPVLGVVTVEPGVTQAMLADFLARGGHPHMVPVTGAGPSAGLLSNALERGYGVTPVADHFAAVTDLEAVLADGSVYRSALREAGGEELARLFKWGIGPYANGLFTQSGFGIVTRMSIALVRRPQAVKVCLFSLKHDGLLEPAVEAIRSLLQALPATIGGINLMNQHRVLAMTAPYPPATELGPDGLMPAALVQAMGSQYQVGAWTGFATLYGRARVVKAAQQEIRHALKGIASRLVFLSPENAQLLQRVAGWLPDSLGAKLRRTATTLNASLDLVQGRPNETALPLAYWRSRQLMPSGGADPARDGCGLLWYAPLVPMRAADVRRFADFARQATTQHGLEPLITFTSQGDRLFDSTIPLLFDLQNPSISARAQDCLKHLTEVGRAHGFYPYRLHVDAMASHLGHTHDSRAFLNRLRAALDPQDLLARGRYQSH